jgi:L-fuconate dehydratase
MCHNRIMFKQFMEAGAMQVCQLDSCRLGGVNEVMAVLLLAARFGVPVCPHAGGVGLCEYVQHLSMIDYVCVSGSVEGRVAEYSDHLHEHVHDPVVMKDGCYMPPEVPGYGVRFTNAALDGYAWPRPGP